MSEDTATTPADDVAADAPSNEVAAQDDAANTEANTEAGTEGDNPPATPAEGEAEELEDVEFEGKQYRVPTQIKRGLLREADYTQKTQAVARAAQELEAKNAAIEQRAQALETTIDTRAELVAVKAQIAAFEKLTDEEWDALEEDDPKEFKRLKRQQDKLGVKATELTTTLQTKETEALNAERAQLATRAQESQAVLVRDIKGWGPKLAADLTEFGKAEGMTNEQLVKLNVEPALVKLLHKAFVGAQALKREAAAKNLQAAQQTKPGTTVGGASPSARKTTDASGDGLSTAEWIAREKARLADKRKVG